MLWLMRRDKTRAQRPWLTAMLGPAPLVVNLFGTSPVEATIPVKRSPTLKKVCELNFGYLTNQPEVCVIIT